MPETPEDLFADFRAGAADPAPAPAAEVRRLGDRRRRRRQSVAVLGGAAAVLVAVAIPGRLADGGADTPAPPPAAGTAVSRPQALPADPSFNVGTGMASQSMDDITVTPGPATQELDLCPSAAWSFSAPVAAVDTRGAWRTGDEHGRHRTVALYADDAVAGRALAALRQAVTACPTDRGPEGVQARRDLWVVDAGDEALGYTWRGTDSPEGTLRGDMTTVRAVRFGNALLVDSTYAPGGSDEDAVARTLEELGFESRLVEGELAALTGAER